MLTFKEFSAFIDAEDNLFIELGEMGDEGIPLQEEKKGVISWDRYAERYAEYIKEFGIQNCFIGVENSDGQLQMLEICNNKVQYKAEAVFKGISFKVIIPIEPEAIQQFCDRANKFYKSDGIWFVDEVAEVATFITNTTYDLNDWSAVYAPSRKQFEFFVKEYSNV